MTKRAVCFGINDYPGKNNDLSGCVNDAEDWSALLIDTFGFPGKDVKVITNHQATMSTMLSELQGLIDASESGDVAVFTYSGHGTWMPDNPENPDESDGRDEALCAYDGNIRDDDIRTAIQTLKPGARLTIVSDSCHSGSVNKAVLVHGKAAAKQGLDAKYAARPRFMPPEVALPAAMSMLLPVRKKIFYPESHLDELLLSGCLPTEYSYDAYLNGKYNGAMTATAIWLIRQDHKMTYREFHNQLRQYLPSAQFPQSPQLEGPDGMKDRTLFT